MKRLVTKIDTSRYKFFEGPDIFKRSDWYYILYSDGGTRPHQPSTVSVLRSRRIEGPWEEDPGNPVLYATDDGSPIQGPAHGTLIETRNGQWFVTFHGHELSHYSLGRPMCLAPIEWSDDGKQGDAAAGDGLDFSRVGTGETIFVRSCPRQPPR